VNKKSLIRQTARRTFEIEAETILGLRAALNEDFDALAQHLFESNGRVIITGIGKSALVGQKIAATFNSTGTPAYFMHASDAIHGDLGMIQPSDTLICLSKSGQTAEIKALIPLVKNLGNRIAGVVAQPDSYLARHADFVLLTPVPKEADPNNLAPTASTTAQMAMGDALALVLLALRGFSPADFAQFHPGGALGKQLYLRARDIYPQNERPLVRHSTPLHEVILEITSKRLGCTVVFDDDDQIAGIITDGDLRRMLEKHQNQNITLLSAKDAMSRLPKTIEADTLAVQAFEMMRRHSITQVIVTEKERYVGIIHLHDLIKEGFI